VVCVCVVDRDWYWGTSGWSMCGRSRLVLVGGLWVVDWDWYWGTSGWSVCGRLGLVLGY